MLPNMLPEVLVGLADEQNDTSTAVTRMRWAAKQAGAGMVMLRRTVELPAVSRTGEVVYADSYTELLTVTASPGPTDPDENETHVQLHLTKVDLDVLGDDEDALKMLAAAGWVIDE